jgi:hypothetical protein
MIAKVWKLLSQSVNSSYGLDVVATYLSSAYAVQSIVESSLVPAIPMGGDEIYRNGPEVS